MKANHLLARWCCLVGAALLASFFGLTTISTACFAQGVDGKASLFEVKGKIYFPKEYADRNPEPLAAITLTGTNHPFSKTDFVLDRETFKFKNIPTGSYLLTATLTGYGLYERTIDIGLHAADTGNQVNVDLNLDQHPGQKSNVENTVSAKHLALPETAKREYQKAYKAFDGQHQSEAIGHLRKALELAPGFAEAWNTLGAVYFYQGDFSEAEAAFRESVKADPDKYEGIVNLGETLLVRDRPEEALEYNEQAVKLRPDDPRSRTQLGWCYLQLNRLDEAENQFIAAARLNPDHVSRPQMGLAQVYRKMGQANREAAALTEYVRRHPDDPEVRSVRVRVANLKKDQ